jgi:hypothetical protein
MFEWVAGRSLRTRMTGQRSAALVRLSARLHQDAAAWSPSGAGDVLLADRVLYCRLPEQLSVAACIVGLGSYVADHAERVRAWMRCPAGL